MKIRCPICHKETEWAESNPFRPFCSERCKLTDLGEWASGKRAIPADHLSSEKAEDDEEPNQDNESRE